MNHLPHDPNSLADELDRVLPPGQVGQPAASNDPLVEAAARLSAAPRPTLSPEALARIHTAMLTGQSVTPAVSQSLTRRFLRQSAPVRLVVAAVVLFAFVSGAIFAAKIGVQLLHPSTATTTLLPPSVTPLPPTETPLLSSPTMTSTHTDTSTLLPPSPTITPEFPLIIATAAPTTPVPTAVPTTAIPTPTASPTLTPTTILPIVTLTEAAEASTAEPTLPVTIVVEGPVQSINSSTIIVFDLPIVLSEADLASVHIGDMIRVEGSYVSHTQGIIAVHVIVLRNTPIPISNNGVETNLSTGQVWTDPGDCSNPPPPWAPANGWRRRCQGASSPGNSGGDGNSNGMGMGMGN